MLKTLQAGTIRTGISGWRYKGWRGVFYPPDLRQKDELSYASKEFSTIEINGTFYSLQSPSLFSRWAESTPDDFVFAVKAPRFITHLKRLKDVTVPLANFWANGLLELGPKLGPILWQLPPQFKFDPERLESFFRQLPGDTGKASRFARKHDKRVNGKCSFHIDRVRPMRHAVEIRHDSFRDPAFIALLRRYDVALVCADTVDWPKLMDVTADFMYCRLHGSEVLYTSGYDLPDLKVWAARVTKWARGEEPNGALKVIKKTPKKVKRDVYVYFDNDAKVRAPVDAKLLHKLVHKAQELGRQDRD